MKVLVIDDDKMLRDVAVMVLEREHEVVTAEGPKEGLRLVAEQDFDVIVCDLEMPVMTGLELWRRLPDHLRERFVLWTGAPDLAVGTGVRVLEKPSGMHELLDVVREAYKG